MQTEVDMTETAMSLTRAMSQSSYRSEHQDNMPELMYLQSDFLRRQENAVNFDIDHGILDFDDKNIFESLLVGALLGVDLKIVKIDS